MSPVLTTILISVAAAGLAWRLVRSTQKSRRDQVHLQEMLAANIRLIVADAQLVPNPAAGVLTFVGHWQGMRVQVQTIMDTLAVRKLPSWWISVTVAEPVKVNGIVNILMRPAMTASFSNFHLRPVAIRTPEDFPDHAAIRMDRPETVFPEEAIRANVDMMSDRRAKELLISPDGLRLVWLMAEGDRARYGVFRQADFGGRVPAPAFIGSLIEKASRFRDGINASREIAA